MILEFKELGEKESEVCPYVISPCFGIYLPQAKETELHVYYVLSVGC